MEGHIFVRGDIGQDFSRDVENQLNSPENKAADSLIVHISSRGGSVYEGYTVYHLLNAWKAANKKPITTQIEGQAQSMATFIALAGDKVIMFDPGVFMIHNPSQGIEGDADALKGGAAELQKIEDEMAIAYQKKTGLSIEKIKEMMKVETSMNAEEAKKNKFVDEVRSQLRAVAYGKTMKKEKTVIQKLIDAARALGGEIKAIDLKTADGKAVHVESEDGDLVNKPITVEGQPAEGTYTLDDGRQLVCTNGMVMEVKEATTTDETAQKIATLEQQLADLKAKTTQPTPQETAEQKAQRLEQELEALKAEKIAEVADTQKALEEAVKALGEQKKKTAGNPAKPAEGMIPQRTPVGLKRTGPNAKAIDATRTFIAQEMSWLKQYYPIGFFNNYEEGGPNALSIVEPNFNFTYPGILTTDLFYKPTLGTPALSDIFTIDQGISFQKQYNVVPGLSKVVKPYTGCGATNTNNSRVQIGNVTLTTKEFRMQEKFCKDDFTQQLTGVYNNLAQEWLKTGEASFDPANTPIDGVINEVLTDAMRRDIFVRATMAAGNSSSADFNQIDGLWDRLIDSSGQSNYCVIRANSTVLGGTALGVGTLAAGIALTNLERCYAFSSNLLKQNFGKCVFWVTGSVYDNFVQSLVMTSGTANISAPQFQNTIDGVSGGNKTWEGGITYKGIPVYPVRIWDDSLADSNNPLNATTRHLILLTMKNNHMLGLENGADLNKIYSWYENKDSARYYRSDFKLGYQYLHCDLQTIAF